MIEIENQSGSRADRSREGQNKSGSDGDNNGVDDADAITATKLKEIDSMRKEEQGKPRTRENSPKSVATSTAPSAMPEEDEEEEEEEEEEEDVVIEEDEEGDEEGGIVVEGGIAVEGGMTMQEEIGGVSVDGEGGGGGGMAGFWRQSRPSSPRMPPPEQSEQSSRPKSRHELQAARYNNLGYWRARRVTFYRNGDPYFPGVEFRFKPGRDIGSLEALLDRLSLRMDLPRGARHIFSMDGDRKLSLDELEDGASYVVSSYKTFKFLKEICCVDYSS
ncbi:Neuronal migration protein doublecortin [Camponotus floridanus]|uniref:Neuronal migration protein doublecortin n=1 Tax=Camponotus floridanus TaxID=104421 RepID=E2AAS0_CAMFO|nr:Neuronal migration protein doublecortin [Camponotus floridanus]